MEFRTRESKLELDGVCLLISSLFRVRKRVISTYHWQCFTFGQISPDKRGTICRKELSLAQFVGEEELCRVLERKPRLEAPATDAALRLQSLRSQILTSKNGLHVLFPGSPMLIQCRPVSLPPSSACGESTGKDFKPPVP